MGGATLLLLSAALLATQAQAQRTSIKFISGPEVVTDLGHHQQGPGATPLCCAGKTVNLVCKVENGKEYPIVWMKKSEDGDSKPLSTGKNLVMDNTSKWTLRSGSSWEVGFYSSS